MEAMRNRLSKGFAILSLNSFLSISAGIHLFAFSMAAFLISDLKVHVTPLPPEVSLLLTNISNKTLETTSSKVQVTSMAPKKELPAQKKFVPEERSHVIPEIVSSPPEENIREAPIENSVSHPPTPEKPSEKHKIPLSVAAPLLLHSEPDQTPTGNGSPLSLKASSSDLESKIPEGSLLIALSPSGDRPKETVPSDESLRVTGPSKNGFNGQRTFVQPLYASNPKPTYPREARRKGYEGEVILKVQVLSNGGVGSIEIGRSSGYELLDQSALEAVKKWRFTPAKEGEDSVPSWVKVPVRFRLQ